MREFLILIISFNMKKLLIEPTSNIVLQIFRALMVGTIAFIVDAGILWYFSLLGLHYLICTVFGFLAGVSVNYIMSVKFVFKDNSSISRKAEIALYVILGILGLGLTIIFMWFFTEIIGLFFMISRSIAAVLVFAFNFLSRKIILYRD